MAAKYIISSKSGGQTYSTCLCQADYEWQGIAWHGMEWHRMRHEEGRRGGTWLLERDQWLSFNLGALYVGKERALSLLCCVYTQRAKGGSEASTTLLTPSYIKRLHSPSERQGRFGDVHVDRALQKPFDVPLLFEGTAERLEDFWMWCQEQQARRQLCARGGGSAQESKMAGEERKIAYQRGGVPRNWS